jgi:hypothetical protein
VTAPEPGRGAVTESEFAAAAIAPDARISPSRCDVNESVESLPDSQINLISAAAKGLSVAGSDGREVSGRPRRIA